MNADEEPHSKIFALFVPNICANLMWWVSHYIFQNVLHGCCFKGSAELIILNECIIIVQWLLALGPLRQFGMHKEAKSSWGELIAAGHGISI